MGDQVLVKNHKLSYAVNELTKKFLHIYEGPFIISKIKDNFVYEIKYMGSNKIKGVYNARQLKPNI